MSQDKWEYKILLPQNIKVYHEFWELEPLNKMGAEGWEFVAIQGRSILLKRKISASQ